MALPAVILKQGFWKVLHMPLLDVEAQTQLLISFCVSDAQCPDDMSHLGLISWGPHFGISSEYSCGPKR